MELQSPAALELQSHAPKPAGKRRKLSSTEYENMDSESDPRIVECKLGAMPEGQKSLRKRKRYLA